MISINYVNSSENIKNDKGMYINTYIHVLLIAIHFEFGQYHDVI